MSPVVNCSFEIAILREAEKKVYESAMYLSRVFLFKLPPKPGEVHLFKGSPI
jgi:hypothetical protein